MQWCERPRCAPCSRCQTTKCSAAWRRCSPIRCVPCGWRLPDCSHACPGTSFNEKDRTAFDAALAEYMTGQKSLDDQPAAHLNMAVIYSNLGQSAKAEAEYHTALRIDASFVPRADKPGDAL